jgi:hypothetical protein
MSLGWNTGNFPGASHAHTISSDVIDDLTPATLVSKVVQTARFTRP